MLAHVKLLMFLFVLAKLLPERHNLYGDSLDFKLKYMREKKMPSWKYFPLTNLPCSLPAYSRTWEEWRIDEWSEVHPDIDLNVVHKHTNKQIQRAFQDNGHVNTIELKGEHVEDCT